MDYQLNYINPEIKLSCYEGKLFKTEAAFDDHLLVWLISGETKIIQADETFVFGAGNTFLIPRHQLATIMNVPKDGLPHKAVAMHLSIERLRNFYIDKDIKVKPLAGKIISFHQHPLLQSCLASLIPYFDMQDNFPEDIASLKITEAISILRSIDKGIDDILANFEEPHKIELTGFMEKNFMFNMPLERFGYLTGRSLTTFKRDFSKAFNMTPQRWLTRKRLELAHYEFTEKRRRPVEVCYETGFENLSHFSYAFKKHYGYAPTELLNRL
ncbi:AraC family transcriptional regulator [Pedobacter faecalis]|uniref:AraC family transcriptional regulator n=1 Tax=Pedobacter faecalis TaxID=3041495 RepID=UPI00254E6369|nr:helix-turn-helix domain-containing protein [Pedobacter sp. ELA7]